MKPWPFAVLSSLKEDVAALGIAGVALQRTEYLSASAFGSVRLKPPLVHNSAELERCRVYHALFHFSVRGSLRFSVADVPGITVEITAAWLLLSSL